MQRHGLRRQRDRATADGGIRAARQRVQDGARPARLTKRMRVILQSLHDLMPMTQPERLPGMPGEKPAVQSTFAVHADSCTTPP